MNKSVHDLIADTLNAYRKRTLSAAQLRHHADKVEEEALIYREALANLFEDYPDEVLQQCTVTKKTHKKIRNESVKEQAFAYIREHTGKDPVSNKMTVHFSKDDAASFATINKAVKDIIDCTGSKGIKLSVSSDIHASTLKSILNKIPVNELPIEVFSIYTEYTIDPLSSKT